MKTLFFPKIICIFLMQCLVIQSYAQESDQADFTQEIKKYDVSTLWTATKFMIEDMPTEIVEREEPIGYIGADFQRFRIHFTAVIKNPKNPLQYFAYGKSKVKNNICSFIGTITISTVETYLFKDISTLRQGSIIGEYEFYEDAKEPGTGTFTGKFSTEFYLNKEDKLLYNGLMAVADGFSNNQFEGRWTSYKTGKTKPCNWGDYRIPDSRTLDIGAGEFVPSEKYINNGWRDFLIVRGYLDSNETLLRKAEEKESAAWWQD